MPAKNTAKHRMIPRYQKSDNTVQLQRHLRMLLSNRNSEEHDWNVFIGRHKYGKLHATALQ